MPQVDVYSMQGAVVGQVQLSDDIFAQEMNAAIVHQVVKAQLANKRQGTQSALTRSEVRGGGRKPWRQKGTGRARQGSTRSPQWTHGGIVFAPKPRSYHQSVPRKVRRLALKCVLSDKVASGDLIVLDSLSLTAPKTREMAALLKAFNAKGALLVMAERSEDVVRASGNIGSLKLSGVGTLNVYDIMKFEKLVITRDALPLVEEVYA